MARPWRRDAENSFAMTKNDERGPAETPLSRRLTVAETPPEGLDVVVTANARELGALARANGLPALNSLEARLHVARAGADGLNVDGDLRADTRQTCVVTLEDFDALVAEPIHARFVPPKAPSPKPPPPPERSRRGRFSSGLRGREDEPEEEPPRHGGELIDEDPPEPLIGGAIDLGAIVSEFLTLGLDPYPRKPGASFAEPAPGEDEPEASPFASLRRAIGTAPDAGEE
jgi:hypothetical protein